MGDEILVMKKLLLILFISVYGFSNIVNNQVDTNSTILEESSIKSSLVAEYQEMFEKIGQQRVGLEKSEIEKVRPPFLKIVKKKKEDENKLPEKIVKKLPPLILEAILGSSARINGIWYNLNQKIRDAKIVSISGSTVVIRSVTYKKKLTLRSGNANISIK